MWPSSPVGDPGFPGISEASFSHSYCPEEQCHPRPSFLAPKPRAALLESSTGGGQSRLEMDNGSHSWGSSSPSWPVGWNPRTGEYSLLSSLPPSLSHTFLTLSNLLFFPLSRVSSSWKLNFGCRICELGHEAVRGGSAFFGKDRAQHTQSQLPSLGDIQWWRRNAQASLGGEPLGNWTPAEDHWALSRTDCAEQLFSNGILVVSLEPLPQAICLSPASCPRSQSSGSPQGSGAEPSWGTLGFQFLKKIQAQVNVL